MAYEYGPVVVGVDGSPSGLGALRWAADEACRHTRMLHVVNVRPGAGAERAAPDIAAQAAAEARRWRVGVAAEGETRSGSPVPVLRELAGRARLVVVGSHGAGGDGDRPLGSVSRALATRADAPVLIVQGAERWAAPDAALPRDAPVVVGFDGSDSAGRALRLAFDEAHSRGTRLVIVQAWPHPRLWRPGGARAEDLTSDESSVRSALQEAAAPWCGRYPCLDVEVRSEPGDPVSALAVVSQWAALLVVGTRCPSDRVQPPNPSVAGRVLRHAACPVLVAHGPGLRPGAQPATTSATARRLV